MCAHCVRVQFYRFATWLVIGVAMLVYTAWMAT